MDFATKDPLEELATAPLGSADPAVQLAAAEQAALASGPDPRSLPGGAVAAPPGTTGVERPAAAAHTDADSLALALDANKKLVGDVAGSAAFRHGTWNGGSRQGEALKGSATTGVNLGFGIAKVALAKTPEEREKAIKDLATGTAGDVANIGGGPIAGAGVKGALSIALAKDAKERKEAVTDGAIDTGAEVAGKFGGNVAKAVVQSGGGLLDVFSKESGSFERAATSQRHFKRLLGNIPFGVGNFLGNKITGSLVNEPWARRNGGIYNAGDGTFTMPNGTNYDPKKGAPAAENTKAGIPELTEADKRRLDRGTP